MRKTYGYFFVAIAIVAFVVIALGLVMLKDANLAKFDKNVQIDGIAVGGMTTEKATLIVAENMKKNLEENSIKLKYNQKEWTLENFNVDSGVKNVVNKIFKTTKFSDKDAINFISQNKNSFNTAINDVYVNFDEKIDEIIAEIEVEPTNAKVNFYPNKAKMFEIVPEKYGTKVDREKLVDEIEQKFEKREDVVINIQTELVEPEIKSSFFDDKLNLQSKFSTSIKNSQAGRRNNVNVALQKLCGMVIEPEQTISFNEITSPQDSTGGYQDAIIIKNGKFVNGMGGGICQASTTFYNACLMAGLEVLEVHKHTLPVHYVLPALDAMVSGYADLKIKNTSEFPVYVKSYVNGDDAVVEIYGKSLPQNVTEIKLSSEITKTLLHDGDKVIEDVDGEYQDKVLYKGEYYRLKYPKDGYEATAFIEYYDGDKLVDKQMIRKETYEAEQGILIEGTAELPDGFVLPEQTETIIAPKNTFA